jgi:small ubiquitin-related modifier
VHSDGSAVMFRVKPTTKFEKIIQSWCDKKAVDPATMRFHYDSGQVTGQDTPLSLDMDDGDQIDVAVEQVGGNGRECAR